VGEFLDERYYFTLCRRKHFHHCSGSQPVGLLQCCLRWSSILTFSDYSQSSTQPYVWSPAHRDAITWLLCYATAIGCQSNSASSTSCVVCMMVHRCLYGDAPSYLADLITPSAAATVRPGLRSAASSSVAVPQTISLLGDRSLRLLAHVHGTNFHHRFVAFTLLILLNVNLRHYIFGGKVHPSLKLRVFAHLWSRSDALCIVAFCMGINICHRRKFGQVWGSPGPLPDVAGKLRCRKAPLRPSTITWKNRNHSAM